MSAAGAATVVCAARSETGERDRNEDRALVRVDGARTLALVADGAGGHAGGAEASRRAAARLESALHGAPVPFARASLEAAVQAAHRDVQQGAAAEGGQPMHTTLVVLWVDADAGTFLWASVGDSRLYRVREGGAERLTTDDSVVQRLVDAGMLTEALARVHPQRNQLVAALGIDDALEPHGPAEPQPLRSGDAFLLCSDGWWGGLDDEAVAQLHARVASPDAWLDAMEHELRARRDPRQDNYTAVAVWVDGADADAPTGETTRPMTTL
jgi:serine/threonine protein phosphatase PrpC